MEFALNDRQLEVQRKAGTFAADVLAPRAMELDRVGGFPRESLQKAADLGLLGINVPRELGGLGAGSVGYSLAVTELAGACAATTVALCVSNMVAEVVAAFGTEAQRKSHVPKLCSGEYVVGGFALSEAGAGSDPGGMRTRAEKIAGGWRINGSKLWITSGTDAGLFVVWARTNSAAGARGLSAFLVRGDTPGLERGKPEHKMGLNGSTTTALDFTDVEVRDEDMLLDEGQGFRVAMMALDGGRIGIASQALGIGLAALRDAVSYVRGPGAELAEPLAGQQGIAWLLADSATELEAGRLLTLRAAWRKEHDLPFSSQASMAKVWATERAYAATERALQAAGIAGYDATHSLQRYFRDVRVTMIYEGTSEVQRIVLGRDIQRRFAEA